MISVTAYKTYKKHQTGMTDVKDLQVWLKETTRNDWPINLINYLLTEGNRWHQSKI